LWAPVKHLQRNDLKISADGAIQDSGTTRQTVGKRRLTDVPEAAGLRETTRFFFLFSMVDQRET
jgi:hypothetical protein